MTRLTSYGREFASEVAVDCFIDADPLTVPPESALRAVRETKRLGKMNARTPLQRITGNIIKNNPRATHVFPSCVDVLMDPERLALVASIRQILPDLSQEYVVDLVNSEGTKNVDTLIGIHFERSSTAPVNSPARHTQPAKRKSGIMVFSDLWRAGLTCAVSVCSCSVSVSVVSVALAEESEDGCQVTRQVKCGYCELFQT